MLKACQQMMRLIVLLEEAVARLTPAREALMMVPDSMKAEAVVALMVSTTPLMRVFATKEAGLEVSCLSEEEEVWVWKCLYPDLIVFHLA